MDILIKDTRSYKCERCGYVFRYILRGQTRFCTCCYDDAVLSDEW